MKNNFPKISLVVFLLLFCVLLFVLLFSFKTINKNDKESQQKESKWQNEALRREELRLLDHSIDMIKNERAQLETHFAKSSDVVPFLDTIEKLAGKVNSHAEVTSVDVLKDRTGLMVGMKASGTFANLYRFLTLLENSPYELEFLSVDMGRGVENKDTKTPAWDLVLKMKLLSFVD